MKWIKFSILYISVAVLMVGCGDDDESPLGPNKEEVQAYVEEVGAISEEESSIINDYASVTGDNYTNDATLLAMIVDLIPRCNAFIAKLEAITPPSELRAAHETWIRAWNLQAEAFILVQVAITNNDGSLVVEANEKLAEARKLMRDFLAEFEEIMS